MEHSANAVLGQTLDGFVAATAAERDDVERVRLLLDGGDPWSRATPLHVTASALIVDRVAQKVLLRWHERQQTWLQVGGHGDPGETDPLAVAMREGEEETGLTDLAPWSDHGLCHVVIVPVPAASHELAHEHADLRFVLATERATEAVAEHENAPLRWLTFAEAGALTGEDNVRETLRRAQRLVES